jgi:Fur family peroxide stress response transcriptional regulator
MHSDLAKVKREKAKQLEIACRQNGLPVTIQRRAVLEALIERDDHPTVDQLFANVKSRIPGVSRTTVYRALETLVQLGVSRKTNHFEATARFDANTEHHHHLICGGCSKISDLEDRNPIHFPFPDTAHTGFRITDYSVYFEGLCSKCQKKPSVLVRKKADKR